MSLRGPPGGRWIRPVLLVALLVAEALALWIQGPGLAEPAMNLVVLCLFVAAPFLVWFLVEPEPARPEVTVRRRWLQFPFLRGGSSGAAYFLLVLALVVGAYLVWLRTVSEHRTWLGDDDPVQLLVGALYACVYVLLPTGLAAPFLHRPWGRALAVLGCLGSYPLLKVLFPRGPHGPEALTELGDPWRMITTMHGDGTVLDYARDDLAVLAGLAALGALLHVPRVVRRWRALGAS